MSAASYVLLEFPRSIDEMEGAHAAYRSEGDGPGAVRTARTLGYLHGTTTGDWAIAGGWIARAKTLPVDQLVIATSFAVSHRGTVRMTS